MCHIALINLTSRYTCVSIVVFDAMSDSSDASLLTDVEDQSRSTEAKPSLWRHIYDEVM